MRRFKSRKYTEIVDRLADLPLEYSKLKASSILITGGTGLIGTMLVDLLMRLNSTYDLGIKVTVVTRSRHSAERRFDSKQYPDLEIVEADITSSRCRIGNDFDYIFHLASPTHPLSYAADPIGVIKANVNGLELLLESAAGSGARLVFASSVEIYGENRGDTDRFDEQYLGYIDCNTVRAGYNESKRLCEAMCQAWLCQKHVDVVIARLARVYGPTVLSSDSKASTQFIKNALAKEEIVLKSAGTQLFSYLYVEDAISGLLCVALNAASGEVYNLADPNSEVTLRSFAETVANWGETPVTFTAPKQEEAAGYSKATKALLDSRKIKEQLGWEAKTNFSTGIQETLDILREIKWATSNDE